MPESDFIAAPAAFFAAAGRRADAMAYYVREAGGWRGTAWRDYARDVRRAARALIRLGVEHGDSVCILGFNRPEWTVMDIAAMSVGARPAGIYWTAAPEQIAYVLDHSRCKVLLAESEEHFAAIRDRLTDFPHLTRVVMMRGADRDHPGQTDWDTFLASGDASADGAVERRLEALVPEDIGKQIYTSGTTGNPKAVQISHGALWWTSKALTRAYGSGPDDRLLSYLPLAHIAEQMATVHQHIDCGYAVYFARSIAELGDHLKEVRPTVFFAVPRVFEKMADGVREKTSTVRGIKRALVDWAQRSARSWHLPRLEGHDRQAPAGPGLRVARRIVLDKVKAAMGLDAARLILCGAAPVSRQTLEFFAGLDLPLCEVYGQSEVTGPTTLNLPGANRLGTAGRPPEGIEVRIADDGEILVRGPNVFSGYAGDPEATAETLRDGWLHSGDLGHLDDDGYLVITGRKKDLIVTSGGKNIAPAAIERDLMALPHVEHAVVCGDNRHFLCALITLDESARARLAKASAAPAERERLRARVAAGVEQVNARRARVEQVRKFELLERPLSIAAGELTPTMKVCRQVVLAHNADRIEALYRPS